MLTFQKKNRILQLLQYQEAIAPRKYREVCCHHEGRPGETAGQWVIAKGEFMLQPPSPHVMRTRLTQDVRKNACA